MKVLIGMPTQLDEFINYRAAMFCAVALLKKHFWRPWSGRSAENSRNNLITKVLLPDPSFTHIFFLDADTIPASADIIERLLEMDKPIATALCRVFMGGKKYWNIARWDKDGTNNIKLVEYGDMGTEPFTVDGVGASCVLIRREVFEKMEWPYYRTECYRNGEVLSHDLYFCVKAAKLGYQIWVNPKLVCKHSQRNDLDSWFDLKGEQ